ncbi:ABC transporter permease [Candidatus Woesearchaeota archaeon]|nr:ABC transporter permease [Candidatus Woesearchaeota archaeon]
MAFTNLSHRRIRTFLTLIGIFVGIAAVVALVSLAQGFQNYLDTEFKELGADKILINPAGSAFGLNDKNPDPLTTKDIEIIRDVNGVKEVSSYSYEVSTVTWGDNDQTFATIITYPLDENRKLLEEITTSEIISGRRLKKEDKFKAVIGYNYQNSNKFSENLITGKKIIIENKQFEVIGINDKIGSQQDDEAIYITQEAYFEIYPDENKEEVGAIFVRVKDGESPSEIVEKIEKDLRKNRNVKEGEEDFEVTTFEDLIQSFLNIFNIVQVVLVGIAAISLVVGGIGIMNTMYTAVIERTKDIGVMKAIGARNSDVLLIFVIESGFLGLVGGAMGVILGIILAKTVEYFGTNAFGTELLKAAMPWWLILGALAFAFTLGAVFGTLPARRASKMNPVDALRTE